MSFREKMYRSPVNILIVATGVLGLAGAGVTQHWWPLAIALAVYLAWDLGFHVRREIFPGSGPAEIMAWGASTRTHLSWFVPAYGALIAAVMTTDLSGARKLVEAAGIASWELAIPLVAGSAAIIYVPMEFRSGEKNQTAALHAYHGVLVFLGQVSILWFSGIVIRLLAA